MATPKILKILNKTIIIAIIVIALSFIIPITPCKTAPVITEPVYKWTLCKLPNPFGEQLVGVSTKFYNISTEPLAGTIIQFILALVIFTAIFMLFRRKVEKVLDLTKK